MHEVIPGAYVKGNLTMNGEDIYSPSVDPVKVRRQVGMVFQRPNPRRHLKARTFGMKSKIDLIDRVQAFLVVSSKDSASRGQSQLNLKSF